MRHSSYLEINLGLLEDNVKKVKKLTSAEILPMVKANAYGNGLVPISSFLVNELGMKKLGCASLGEALTLINEVPDLDAEIVVFSDTEIHNPELRELYQSHNITPVLHQISDVEEFLKHSEFKATPVVLKVETGMNRLGISLNELEKIAPRLKNRGVKHLMSHFACSYFPLKAEDKTHRQMSEFLKAKKLLEDVGVEVEETSVSNSGAIEQGFGVNETYVRPGLMLYGPFSVEPQVWNGHQISRFVTKILKTFLVKKGTPVGYGINVAGEDTFIAILPIGYGDGISTFSSGATIKVGDEVGRIWARVNMDMTFVAFDPSAEGKIKSGDTIEIWNHDNKVITNLANQMKTIPYQLMCGITQRIPRIYKVK